MFRVTENKCYHFIMEWQYESLGTTDCCYLAVTQPQVHWKLTLPPPPKRKEKKKDNLPHIKNVSPVIIDTKYTF